MKKIALVTLFSMLLPSFVLASSGEIYPHEAAKVDLADKASLQRGAKYFVNYCMGCHSLSYQRFNRLGRDIGLSDAEVEQNLIFTSNAQGPTKVGELMNIAMDTAFAEEAFGVAPPDLSLVMRSRGPDWFYNYLRGFYADESRPFGVDNSVFPAVAMPHVLEGLQGLQTPLYKTVTDAATGKPKEVLAGFKLDKAGELSPAEYDKLVLDLTNFLTYVGEPAKLTRHRMGLWVLLFLFVLAGVTYSLKKEYWRDVH